MPSKQKSGSGGSKKIGRSARKPKVSRYKNELHRYHNKLKRILKSNGEKAAAQYARSKPCHAKRYSPRSR